MLYFVSDMTGRRVTITAAPSESEVQAAQRHAQMHARSSLIWRAPDTDEEREAGVAVRARVDDGAYWITPS